MREELLTIAEVEELTGFKHKLLTTAEVVELTGLSRMTLLRLREKRRIGFTRLGDRSIRYTPRHVAIFLKSRDQPTREPRRRSEYVN